MRMCVCVCLQTRPVEQYPEAEDDMSRYMRETGILEALGVEDRLPKHAVEVSMGHTHTHTHTHVPTFGTCIRLFASDFAQLSIAEVQAGGLTGALGSPFTFIALQLLCLGTS